MKHLPVYYDLESAGFYGSEIVRSGDRIVMWSFTNNIPWPRIMVPLPSNCIPERYRKRIK